MIGLSDLSQAAASARPFRPGGPGAAPIYSHR
jgi:hypothetical protein